MIGNALGGQMAGAPTFGVATPAPNMGGISSLAPKTGRLGELTGSLFPSGFYNSPFQPTYQNRSQPVGMAEGGAAPTLQPQEFFDFRRIPGGPIPGGVTYYDDPTFRPDASNIEMRAMAQFLSGTEGVSPQTMFERILRLSNSELRNLKNSIPMSAFTEFQPRGDQTIEEMIQENEEMFNQKMRQVERPPQGMEKGGAAFPDLTGDGKVTYADILKGRGVEMQMGGEPMMAQQAAMMQAPMPQDPSMGQAMAQAAQVGVDPAAVEGMLSQVSEGIGNLDDAEDFEQVMNSMRGNEAPISERYAELAELVGEEDAEATPESVLTLVQPVMQIAQVDQGIGGLAQEEMSAPVEGNMAGGIMSTVNMGEEVPAPVNFNQGGPVVAMANGGNPYYQEALNLRRSVLSPESQQQAFEDQKRMTQAQMLFDIAQGALAFATPGERQMSAAERLAQVAQPVAGSIGARAGELQKFKQGQEAEDRALKLSAITAAEQRQATKEAQDFAASESALDRANQIALKNLDIIARQETQESDQEYGMRMLQEKAAIDAAAAALANDNSIEAMKIKNSLDIKKMRLENVLTKNNIRLQFKNRIKEIGILNTNELARMEKGNELAKGLADHNNQLQIERDNINNTFTAAQNALQMVHDNEKQYSSQAFQMAMQEEMQKFTSDQAVIDRAIAQAQRSIDNAFATSADARADKELALKIGSEAFQQSYQAGLLALEEMKLEADKLTASKFGSGDMGKAMTNIANESFLLKYAEGTLDKEVDGIDASIMEQSLNFVTKPQVVFDKKTGRDVMGPALDLTTFQKDAIKNRVKNGFPVSERLKKLAGVETGAEGADGSSTVTSVKDLSPIEKRQKIEDLINSPYAMDLTTDAFGSDKFFAKIANIGTEALSLGILDAPFKDVKSAIKAVENLNQEMQSFFMDAQDIRDSVFQAGELKALTPKPGKFWEGSSDAASSAKQLYQRLDRAINIINYRLTNPNIRLEETGQRSASDLRSKLPQLMAMRDGYRIISNIAEASGVGSRPLDQQKLIQDLENKIK
jgi:hypothetical protein